MDENGGITSLSQSDLGERLGGRVQHSPPRAERVAGDDEHVGIVEEPIESGRG